MKHTNEQIKKNLQDHIEQTQEKNRSYLVDFCLGYYGYITKQIWQVIRELTERTDFTVGDLYLSDNSVNVNTYLRVMENNTNEMIDSGLFIELDAHTSCLQVDSFQYHYNKNILYVWVKEV